MRHWNSPNLNPLTNKNNEKSENKTGANSFLIQYALYIKHICFRLQLTLILVVLLFSLRVVSSVVFNHFYWRVTETGGTCIDIPSDSHGHSCNVTHERTSAARPIALVHVQSSDYLVTRAILLHYHTALAFIVHQLHINARFIARFTAFTSQNGRFESCEFCMSTFSFVNTLWTVYDPYLIFSVARIFCSPARVPIVKGAEDAFKFNF